MKVLVVKHRHARFRHVTLPRSAAARPYSSLQLEASDFFRNIPALREDNGRHWRVIEDARQWLVRNCFW
jgi:hypothetical protein